MEYFPFRSLRSNLSLSPLSALEIVEQCLNGLEYLHSNGVIHRNIKPENIILQYMLPMRVKIIDFGLATDSTCEYGFCGTTLYSAPEMWRGNLYTEVVDIWSLGVTLLQIGNSNIIQLSDKFLTPKIPQPEQFFQGIKQILPKPRKPITVLLNRMLDEDPERRYTAVKCLQLIVEARLDLINRKWATSYHDRDKLGLSLRSGRRTKTRSEQIRIQARSSHHSTGIINIRHHGGIRLRHQSRFEKVNAHSTPELERCRSTEGYYLPNTL